MERKTIENYDEFIVGEELIKCLYMMMTFKINKILENEGLENFFSTIEQMNLDGVFDKTCDDTIAVLEECEYLEIRSSALNEYFEHKEEWARYSSKRKIMEGDEVGHFLSFRWENGGIKIKPILFCRDEIENYVKNHVFLEGFLDIIEDDGLGLPILIQVKEFKNLKYKT